jgi:hypothetical protein
VILEDLLVAYRVERAIEERRGEMSSRKGMRG